MSRRPATRLSLSERYLWPRCAFRLAAMTLADMQTEMQWWMNNRTVSVTSPFSNRTFTMYLYNVTNTAPRPEVRYSLHC